MTKVLVAAIAALFTVTSAPASAQNYKCAPCKKGQACSHICWPTPPPLPVYPPAPRTQQVYPPESPQQVYPQQVHRPLCVVTGVGSCEAPAFRARGSFCECYSDFGDVFPGTVQ